MTKRKTPLVIIALLAIFVTCSAIWFIAERHASVSARNTFNSKESQLLMLQAQLARDKAESKKISSSPLNGKVEPHGQDESDLIREINQSAANSGVGVQSVNFSGNASKLSNSAGSSAPASTKSALQALTASVQVNGSFTSLLNFVNDIQSNNRLSILQNFSISEQKSGYQVSVQLSFPYM